MISNITKNRTLMLVLLLAAATFFVVMVIYGQVLWQQYVVKTDVSTETEETPSTYFSEQMQNLSEPVYDEYEEFAAANADVEVETVSTDVSEPVYDEYNETADPAFESLEFKKLSIPVYDEYDVDDQ